LNEGPLAIPAKLRRTQIDLVFTKCLNDVSCNSEF
jgi:hypothetical protein